MDINSVIEKVKELVRKGNVSRIVVKRGSEELLNISVNAGIIGGVVALAAAKVLLLGAVLATVGFGCTVEVVKDDGQVVDVITEETTSKARETAANVVEQVKKTFEGEKAESADFEETVAADEPAEEETTEE